MTHEQFEIFSNQAVAACAVLYFLAFLAQVAEARCTQMVNPKYSYICKIRKDLLEAYR